MDFYETDNKADGEFSLIKPGMYSATIFDVTTKERDGVQTMSVQYKLENNRRLFQNFKFNESGRKWISWQLGELGVLVKAKETAKPNETIEQTARNIHNTMVNFFVGKPCKLEVDHKEWTNPKTKEKKVYENAKVIAADSAKAPAMDDNDELSF